MGTIRLLDCTLRDGGYLNNWEFGNDNTIAVFERLVSAGIDIIEIGFMDASQSFDINRTIQPDSAGLGEVYQNVDTGDSMIVGMIDYGTCPIENIQPCNDSIMDGIRIIFKKEKMYGAIAFCKQVKALGYQVFAQAVSITSYSDEELDELLCLVNELNPYAFSLVDTYGLLHKGQLRHYFDRANRKLNLEIGLGYHSHNNFQLGYANCIELIESPIEREVIIDGSLYGMGKSAGNTPIELLATYMNDNRGREYRIYQLLEAIDGIILDIRKLFTWGYSFQFYLSASHDCHPNYVSFLAEKKKLSVKSISEILDCIEQEKKLNYDQRYIEEQYINYQKVEYDEQEDLKKLQSEIQQKSVLLLGPGMSIKTQKDSVHAFAEKEKPYTIAVNFQPDGYQTDALFISNSKRYIGLTTRLRMQNKAKIIATSNITELTGTFHYVFCYEKYLDEAAQIVDNPMIMLLKILIKIGVKNIALAGFDGYIRGGGTNYITPEMEHVFIREKAEEINQDVRNSLKRIKGQYELQFITNSLYV